MVQRGDKCDSMKNSEKNTYVKKQIAEATIRLLKEENLRDISVSTICDDAQVSRNSFYRNYVEKEDVLRDYISMRFKEWTAEYDQQAYHSDDDLMVYLFKHLNTYQNFYRTLHERKLLYLLKDELRAIIGPKPEYPNIGAYTAAFIFSGIFGWIEEWIMRGMQESSEAMAELLKQRNG